jgi:peptidoglycan/xylan/chitin deacetylase (PgdA/CDA1 family)
MKRVFLRALRVSGAFATFRLANRLKTLILTYHRFSTNDAPGMTTIRTFGEQLAYLRAHYTIVPLTAIERHIWHGDRLPNPCVAITIDDGYRDSYELAFPLLRRYRAPATMFVVTDFIDGTDWLWPDKVRFMTLKTTVQRASVVLGDSQIDLGLEGRASRLAAAARINAVLKSVPDQAKDRAIEEMSRTLHVAFPPSPPADYASITWDQAREMDASGVAIESHTVRHPILTRVDAVQLARELSTSRRRLEHMLNRSVRSFCYPNGDYDRQIRDEVERAGYRLAVTTAAGLNDASTDPFALRRIHTEPDLTHFMQSTSGFEQAKDRLRRRSRATNAPTHEKCMRLVS